MNDEVFKNTVLDIVEPRLQAHVKAYDALLRNYTKDINQAQLENYKKMTELIENHQQVIIQFMKEAQPAIDVVKTLMSFQKANRIVWEVIFFVFKLILLVASVGGVLWGGFKVMVNLTHRV